MLNIIKYNIEKKKELVAKANAGHSTCALPKKVVIEVEGRSRATAPKGTMTYSLTKISPSPSSGLDRD